MMQLRSYSEKWKRLLLISSIPSFLIGCSIFSSPTPELPPPEPQVIIETKFVEKNIPLQPRPKGLKFNDVQWYVVTPDTVDSLVPMFEKQLGEKWAFFVISVKDYENLALNMADIKRYLEQQRELIIYYETAVQPTETTE